MTTTAIGRGIVHPLPEVNDVLTGRNVQLHIQFFSDSDPWPAVYVLLNNGQLCTDGMSGLKIFLTSRSREALRKQIPNPEIILSRDGVINIDNLKIKIAKFSESRTSAQGELVL